MTNVSPTPRARRVKPVEKRIARTAGIKGTGKCGHEYSSRMSLWPIAGLPVSESTIKERSDLIAEAVQGMGAHLCPDCTAFENHRDAEDEELAILAGFGLPALPELKGSLRQRAWARQERSAMLVGLIADQMWGAMVPRLADAVFEEAISSRFGTHTGEYGPNFQSTFLAMRVMFNSQALPLYWGTRDPAPTEKEMIAIWLMVRDAISEVPMLREDQARNWILMSKSRRMRLRYGAPRANLSTVLAVRMVVSTPGWESPEQMLSAVQQLVSWSNDMDRGMVTGTGQMTLPDMLEQIAVMRALAPQHDDFPF